MNKFFIVMSSNDGAYGVFGSGNTLDQARAAWKLAKGRAKYSKAYYREFVFFSHLPFAPRDRTATEQEADAWVGADGSLNWVRCEKMQLTPAEETS